MDKMDKTSYVHSFVPTPRKKLGGQNLAKPRHNLDIDIDNDIDIDIYNYKKLCPHKVHNFYWTLRAQ